MDKKRRQQRKEYEQRPEVKARIKEYNKKYSSKPEVKAYIKKYNQRPEVKERRREYNQRPEVKKHDKEWRKKWYKKNKDKLLKQYREYRIRTNYKPSRESVNKAIKKYMKSPKGKKAIKKYFKKRRDIDLGFRMTMNMRNRLHMALKGRIKSNTTLNLVGCSIEELKQHLEKQFTNGMSWENYGAWHIDHIKPCASFNLVLEEE